MIKSILLTLMMTITVPLVNALDKPTNDPEVMKKSSGTTELKNPWETFDETTGPVFRQLDLSQNIFVFLDDHPSQAAIPQVCSAFNWMYSDQTHNNKCKPTINIYLALDHRNAELAYDLFGSKVGCPRHLHSPVKKFMSSLTQHGDKLNAMYTNLHETRNRMPYTAHLQPSFVMNLMTRAVDFTFTQAPAGYLINCTVKLAQLPQKQLDALWSTGASLFQNIPSEHWSDCIISLSKFGIEELNALGLSHVMAAGKMHTIPVECLTALQTFSSEQLIALGYSSSIYDDLSAGFFSRKYLLECISAISNLSSNQIYALGRNSVFFQNIPDCFRAECLKIFKKISAVHIDELGRQYSTIFSNVEQDMLPIYLSDLADLPKENLQVLLDNPWILKEMTKYTFALTDTLKVLHTFPAEKLRAIGRNEAFSQGLFIMNMHTFGLLSTCTVEQIDALGRNASVIKQMIALQQYRKDICEHSSLKRLTKFSEAQLDALGSQNTSIFKYLEKLRPHLIDSILESISAFSADQLKALMTYTWVIERVIESESFNLLKDLQAYSVEQLEALGRNRNIFNEVAFTTSPLEILAGFSAVEIDIIGKSGKKFICGIMRLGITQEKAQKMMKELKETL